jgi:hypothetical protein
MQTLKSVNLVVNEIGFQSVNPVNGRIDKSSLVAFSDMPKEALKLMSMADQAIVASIFK